MNHPPLHDGLGYVLTHVVQDFMQFMHHSGLTGSQIHALLFIYHAGECRVSEIGLLTDSSPAAASQLVDRLVQQDLVQRSEDPSNRRIKKLRLTEKSQKLIERGMASNHSLNELMDSLTANHRRVVHTAFEYLAEAGRKLQSIHARKAEQHAQNA